MSRNVLAACIGECAHVAGPINFLRVADRLGYATSFLGPAKTPEEIIAAIKSEQPDIVAISYRLTPENGLKDLAELKALVSGEGLSDKTYVLGALPELVATEGNGFFEKSFQGGETDEVVAYLKGESPLSHADQLSKMGVIERMAYKKPFPLLRHHYGVPSLQETVDGVVKIAESGVLDVISLGVDQDAQANFFHPERMRNGKGAGGVPVRSTDDFKALYEASRRGNFPLMRSYAGTDNLIAYGDMLLDVIDNAWSAIPIFWFNQMDGRGPMDLETSLRVHLDAIKFHADRGVPVEILESHHWSMRDAPDEVAVAAGYLGAAISKDLGVKNFISQYMFNTPAHTTQRDDLAKMLAQKELISSLVDDDFHVYTQTRTGLVSYPVDLYKAKGQLASSTALQMQLDPDIIHVVSYSEANHAATADDVIESAKIVRRVVENSIDGLPSMVHDPYVVERKELLKERASLLVGKIAAIGPIADPKTLYAAIEKRLFHAPQLDTYAATSAVPLKKVVCYEG